MRQVGPQQCGIRKHSGQLFSMHSVTSKGVGGIQIGCRSSQQMFTSARAWPPQANAAPTIELAIDRRRRRDSLRRRGASAALPRVERTDAGATDAAFFMAASLFPSVSETPLAWTQRAAKSGAALVFARGSPVSDSPSPKKNPLPVT